VAARARPGVAQLGRGGAFIPPADLLIDDDGVTVYMDVPGLRSEHLEIELENYTLTVRGDRPFPHPHENGGGPVRSIERGFGRFERSIRVPRGSTRTRSTRPCPTGC
jgi:HSP20 family molecular chaperone IbpA